jgi:acetyltransferase-like isoleucine patch superfamily enzyme
MSEKEKILAGKPYKWDDELRAYHNYAQELLFDFNTSRPGEIEKRKIIIKKVMGQVGDECLIKPRFGCNFGCNIFIGENFIANFNCTILDNAKVIIGDGVWLAPNVCLFTVGHPMHHELRNAKFCYSFPIIIGNNVWIGGGAIVNPGVTIGDNTVIGSGSIVTNDMPANVFAAGNPCRVIREITDEDKQYYYKKLKFEE